MITRSNHNFQCDLLLVMFEVQLENLTKLRTPHCQREENDYLKMIIISIHTHTKPPSPSNYKMNTYLTEKNKNIHLSRGGGVDLKILDPWVVGGTRAYKVFLQNLIGDVNLMFHFRTHNYLSTLKSKYTSVPQ